MVTENIKMKAILKKIASKIFKFGRIWTPKDFGHFSDII